MPTRREFWEKNVKDNNLVDEFLTNYRLPHTDRNGEPVKVGDELLCDWGDSWITGKTGIVLKLGVYSRAGECEGHLLQMDCGITVAPVEATSLVKE